MLRSRWPAVAIAIAVATIVSSRATALPPAPPGPAPGPPRCDLSGEWAGQGVDEAGTRWTFPMRARQEGTTFTATIEWRGSDGHTGTERVRGIVDCAARTLEMHTESLEGPELAPGVYHVQLSADHRSMSGTWEGPNAVPGRFTAVRR